MKLWRFNRNLEKRSQSSYTDTLISVITANASGQTLAVPTATAALEACAGLVARAFASAEISASDSVVSALTPGAMSMIGRSLIVRGEIVFYINVSEGRLALLPAASHSVGGLPDPSSWSYEVTLGGPSQLQTYKEVRSDGVVHLMFEVDPERPWHGIGPLQAAQLAGRLSAETVAALADEASGPRGSLLPIPVDGEDPTVAKLKADVRNLKGKLAFVESGDWDRPGEKRAADWEPRRIGANPTDALINQAKLASREIFAACGVNPAVLMDAQGTAGREAYRQFLFGLIAPLGRIVADELSIKLDTDVKLDWSELRAADISGRARAFQSMVGAGMDVAKAAALSGLLVADE